MKSKTTLLMPLFTTLLVLGTAAHKRTTAFKAMPLSLLRCVWLLVLFLTGAALNRAGAQEGLLNDDFATGNAFNWTTTTSGASGTLVGGKYVVTMAGPNTSGKYRGDIGKSGGVMLHAGTYPIVAIKFNKPPRCNFFFDTNLGAYNNTNNNATKLEADGGNVYYWDLSTGKLGTTTLSRDQPTSLSVFQFKVADVALSSEELAAGDISYEVSWVKTFTSVDALRAFINPSGGTPPTFEYTGMFTHPGLLHNASDLTHIKDLVARKFGRAYKSYELLLLSNKSSAAYTMAGPFRQLTRDNSLSIEGPSGFVSGGTVKNGVESDFMAAYYNALMWNITGNEAHARKAVEIIDAYASFTTGIVGGDAELNGLYGFMLANAAEILRYTYPAWTADKVQQCGTWLKTVFYPTLQNFRPCAHGNWDIICMKALMAIAIFNDDVPMFNKVVNYFYYGEGNGSIDNYVLTAAGQLQESNRDQPHTMLAIGSLAELSEMALKQGIDLYAASSNAILRGYEYTAKYNLGYVVDYQTSYDYCEKNYQDYTPEAISPVGRGAFRAVFEIAYNHYVFRKGLKMPFTLEVLATRGPEGAPFGADNPGYGSLFFYLNSQEDYEFSGGTSDPTAGKIDDNFSSTADGWTTATTGSVATVQNGELTITLVRQSNGTYRGDVKKSAGATVHAGNFPILAIKMKKPAVVNLTFDTNLGAYGNGSNKWTGKVGDDIYYFDLTKGFGAAPNFLSTTAPTVLSTFQFKVADVKSGEPSYTIDWVKTVKTVDELLAFDPNTGKIDDNFTAGTDTWSAATIGATAAAENGHLRVTLAQASGKGRGDIKRGAGAMLYPANYPIVAIKLKKPGVANITFDTNLGSFGNGSNKQTGKVGNDIFYFDLTKTGFGSSGTLLQKPTSLTTFQFKVADITSGETNYQVDWVKSVKTLEELQALVAPRYQTTKFPPLVEKKVGDAAFAPGAVASSALEVVYSSSNPEVATIMEGKIHIVGAGAADITATQPGSAEYYAADPVKQTLTVKQGDQAITFVPLESRIMGEPDFDPGAFASSGLPVSYSSSDESVATIVGGKIHLVSAGTVTITATQVGDPSYLPAVPVSQTLTINRIFYVDADKDGYGSGTAALFPVNEAPEGYAANQLDCDDSQLLYTDGDGDGLGAGTPAACGVANNSDCDDANPVALTASIPDVYALNPEIDAKNTIYLGYGAASLTLRVSPEGGRAPYTYQWNTGETTESIVVSAAGTYAVEITDAKGCHTSASIQIQTLDVRCGNGSDKVQVCHNGKVICVAPSAVQDHLDHGDKLGACEVATTALSEKNSTESVKEASVMVYPNPVTSTVTIRVDALQAGAILQLYNMHGILMKVQQLTSQVQVISLEEFASGVYHIQVKNGQQVTTRKIVKL